MNDIKTEGAQETMPNIKFMGKYTDESQIMKGVLPEDATKFNEPDSFTKLFLMGALVSSPLLILSSILFFTKIGNFFEIPFMQFLIVLLLNLLLLFVHEFIHALSFPKDITAEIWTKLNEGALFVTFYEPISKIRFIMMSLAPNIVLGFIPFVLYLFGLFDFNGTFSNIMGLTSWIMILSGIGDYLNVYNAIKQVPKDGVIFNHGFHSYWVKDKEKSLSIMQ